MKKFVALCLFMSFIISHVAQDPLLYSWHINITGALGFNNILSNVLAVNYTPAMVYVSTNSVPSYAIGPWQSNPNTPTAQNFVFQITRNPQPAAQTTATGLGHIGVWSNGVSIFNAKDAMSYGNQGVWNQNAIVVEGISFDQCLGHPAPGGEYHTHLNPACLYDYTNTNVHSPIIGYAFDGYPIYGAYAYANPDGTGGVVRMRSSYQLRNMANRQTLADGTVLNANQYGPAITMQYPLGYYLEDFEYVSGLGDLDAHNGRFCVTPEYPNGIYCYYATLNEEFEATYPYVLGPRYYGTVTPGNTGPQGGHNTIPGNAVAYAPTGVSEQESTNPLKLYFNGNSWVFSDGQIRSFSVYNSNGAWILNDRSASVDCENWSSGVYFVACQSNDLERKIFKCVHLK